MLFNIKIVHEKRQLRFVENLRVTSQIFKGLDYGWTCTDLKEYNYALETLRPGCMLEGISGHYLTMSKTSVYSVLDTFLFRSNRCSCRAS